MQRALNLHHEITCAFEPDFSEAGFEVDALIRRMDVLAHTVRGFKHVWDPSGYPYRSEHRSSPECLGRYAEASLAATAVVLSRADRVIFLRRRNSLARVISDLLGQQTDLWGPAFPDGHLSHGIDEVGRWRDAVVQRAIEPVDPAVVDWYLNTAPRLEARLRARCDDEACLDVFYEDLFKSPEAGLDAYVRALEFLGFPADRTRWPEASVRLLFDRNRKLNNLSTLARIPNIRDITRSHPMFTLDLAEL